MSSDFAQPFVLYTSLWSMCSTQTRLTLAVRGEAGKGARPIVVEQRDIDIFAKLEQLDEDFMLRVNPKGQVPVLVNPQEFSKPLTESLDMAKFLISRHPSLAPPEEHSHEGEKLLEELHDLDYFTLSFAHAPTVPISTMAACEKALANATSGEHRKVLEKKLEVYKSHKGREINKEELAALDKTALQFIEKARQVLQRSGGPWIYGAHGPTALDAHFIVFLQRMMDAGHHDYFDNLMRTYHQNAISIPQWEKVMQGRRTLPEGIINE